MVEAVTICVIPFAIGDDAYDDMCLQRCLDALASSDDTKYSEIVLLTPPYGQSLAELMSSRSNGLVLLLASDIEPVDGFLSLLLLARAPMDGLIRVYSPNARGVLSWPPLPVDWGPATASRFARQVALFEGADWPRLSCAAESEGTSMIEELIDAADEHVVVDDSIVLSHRAETLVKDVAGVLPQFTITRCGGAAISAASASFSVARAALRTWLELSTCGIHEACEPLAQWRIARSRLSLQARLHLPRWMTHCDQHAEGIIHESLLCPTAVGESRDAIVRNDYETARSALRHHPDSYCAAVAVMALAPEMRSSDQINEIPRVIVQGWFDSDLPLDANPKIDAWVTLHPKWQHLLFDTATAGTWIRQNLGPDFEKVFDNANPVAKANLFRYSYLAQEGGVWADVDDRAVASVDDLVRDRHLVIVRESLGAIGDNFIAVTPGHPILAAARDEAFRNESDGYEEIQWLANGPAMFTRKVACWVAGVLNSDGLPEQDLDYCVVPGARMIDFVSMHENLDYKSTSLAWDADDHRASPGSLYRGEVPVLQSARQRALMKNEGRV